MKDGAVAQGRAHVDPSAQPLDRREHHVEADAPARGLRHLAAAGEAGREDGADDLIVAELAGAERIQDLEADGPLAHGPGVDAPAVVGHLDVQGLAGQPGPEHQGGLGRLARLGPPLGVLDAVVDGVLDQVQQRLGQPLEHLPVDLGDLPLGAQLHLLAQLAREGAHGDGVAVEQEAQGHHAQVAGRRVEAAHQPAHLVGLVAQAHLQPGQRLAQLVDLAAGELPGRRGWSGAARARSPWRCAARPPSAPDGPG